MIIYRVQAFVITVNSNQEMKHMQENSKFLEKYIQKVHEELKMRIKFCKQRVNEADLVLMLLEYVDHESKSFAQDNKENQGSDNMQRQSEELMRKNREIDDLKEQARIQAELTRNFFRQVQKEHAVDPSIFKFSREFSQSEAMTPSAMFSSVNQQMMPAVEPFSEQVNSSPNLIESVEVRPSKQSSFRSPRLSEATSVNLSVQEREKSKTFARLRKVEAMFCNNSKKAVSRNKSLTSGQWSFANRDDSKMVTEENENLRAIQSNLVTHLSIMQKYKNVPSVQQLAQKEEKIRKRELELKELESTLEKRQRNLNKSHIEVLRKQKSFKAL